MTIEQQIDRNTQRIRELEALNTVLSELLLHNRAANSGSDDIYGKMEDISEGQTSASMSQLAERQ